MFQKKTSRRNHQSRDRMLELRVSSPRIIMFGWLRFGAGILKVGVLMLVAGAIAFVFKGGWEKLFLHNVDEFGLTELGITDFEGKHTQFLSQKRVEEATGLNILGERTIFQFDAEEIEQGILALPEISKVEVTRRLPDRFDIQVKERIPVAWIACRTLGLEERSSEKGLLLDEEGIPFQCAADTAVAKSAKDLPVLYIGELAEGSVVAGKAIEHEGLLEALKLVTGMAETLGDLEQPTHVIVKDEIILEARTKGGTVATFSYFDQKRQIDNFCKLVGHARLKGAQLASVNLIPYRLVPVTYR